MTSLPNPLGGERRSYEWRGHSVAYVVNGAGRPIVFIHSIHAAAWSSEWRFTVPAVAERYTTYAIDLLGFGASDRPPIHYTSELYLALIRDFLRDVVGKPCVLVGSSLGGTYALAIAAQTPTFSRAVCAVGPAGVSRLAEPGGTLSHYAERLLRSRFPGEAMFAALTSRAAIPGFLKKVYARPEDMPPDAVEIFWLGAHAHGARYAPAAFIGMKLNFDLRPVLPQLERPFLLLWGERAGQTPIEEAMPIRALAPKARFAMLPGGDLPHEERPDAFNTTLLHFLDGLG